MGTEAVSPLSPSPGPREACLVRVRAQARCSVYMPVGPLLTRAGALPRLDGAWRSSVRLRSRL